jgi:formylglycine-generating enzyme required for sulfatase activity
MATHVLGPGHAFTNEVLGSVSWQSEQKDRHRWDQGEPSDAGLTDLEVLQKAILDEDNRKDQDKRRRLRRPSFEEAQAFITAMLTPPVRVKPSPGDPEMVSISGGSFVMGSAHPREGPAHTVTVAPFEMSKFCITFDQYDACTMDGVCPQADDAGWGRGDRPVINVSWDDANAYCRWLSEKTGVSYGLPTEAQWEYAARAGTQTEYYTGELVNSREANFNHNTGKTEPVGSYPPNDFGLHDMIGNVWEWTSDCWNGDHAGAPADGSSRLKGDCSQHPVRGGCWTNGREHLRSSSRLRSGALPSKRTNYVGFRVVRAAEARRDS